MAFTTSGVPPSSRTAYDYSIRHLYDTARQLNEPYTLGKPVMSLLFPTLPDSLDLPRGTPRSAFLYTSYLLLEVGIGDLG